jgi:very-short-patch-repair endonuclease
VLESLLRVLLVEAGCAPDDSQVVVRDRQGHFIGRVDLWYAVGLVVEADGFAFHSERSDYRRDRRLGNALEMLRVRMLRFTWEDVVGDPGYVVATVREVLLNDETFAHNVALDRAG